MTILFPKYHFYILYSTFYIFIARNRNGKKVTLLCGGKDLVNTEKNQIQRIRKFL